MKTQFSLRHLLVLTFAICIVAGSMAPKINYWLTDDPSFEPASDLNVPFMPELFDDSTPIGPSYIHNKTVR